jgi:ketosteroid isomerase-like protein
MAGDTRSVEERLQRLEDREEIWNLFMEYKRHLDQRDLAAYSRLFTDEAVWIGNLGEATGPAAIEALLLDTLEIWDHDKDRCYHLGANPVIELDGDRATSESTWVYITRGFNDEPVVALVGHYVDQLVRTTDGWRFHRREAYLDVPYEEQDFSA